MTAWADGAWLDLDAPSGLPPAYALTTPTGPLLITAEVEMLLPGTASVPEDPEWMGAPWLDTSTASYQLESVETLRASDRGYRTRATDPLGVVAYPARLAEAGSIDRAVNLAPGSSAAGASWGEIRLANTDRRYDVLIGTRNVDGRPARLRVGRKVRDVSRGYDMDPPDASLADAWRGFALPWRVDDTHLIIPLRDATYWAERPLQSSLYAGTGGYEGTAELAGLPRPKARGGTASAPIRGVSLVLIDPANRIYQYSDGLGAVVTLYERGGAVFTPGSDYPSYAALAAATVASGAYATCDALSLVKLGATAEGEITADVVAAFPMAGYVSSAGLLALRTLTEDMALDPGLIDVGSFVGCAAAWPYTAGYYAAEAQQGLDTAAGLLGSIGCRLVPTRSGRLAAVSMRRLSVGVRPAAIYTTAHIVSATPVDFGTPLTPPASRWRVAWGRNHTVQTTDYAAGLSDARKQALAQEWQVATAPNTAVAQAYARPSDPDPVQTDLLDGTQAAAIVADLVAMFGDGLSAFDLEMPTEFVLRHEIGDVLAVQYPQGALARGPLVRVTGDSIRLGEPTAKLRVLVEPQ
ncbi:hypothetical protein [Azospirillum himalayense]|uniref:Tail protein n=1 Tax=Azospirillum himalayense TaxID=654847 RepID=A0ABW0GBS0_9PROT